MLVSGEEGFLPDPDEEVNALAKALRIAFASAPLPDCPLGSQPALNDEQVRTLKRVQARARPASAEALDIACFLAYFQVDYDANAEQLTAGCAAIDSESAVESEACRTLLAGHLARLYDRWKDPLLLMSLLDANVPERGRSEALLALWDENWLDILRAASERRLRRQRIAKALLYAKRQFPRPLIFTACIRRVRQGLYFREGPLRSTCLEILVHVKLGSVSPCRQGRSRHR